MHRSSIKIAIPFLCLLYCFAFFEIDLPGYTQTYQDTFDTYVHQQHQNDTSPSQEFHFSYLTIPAGFSVIARQETLGDTAPYFADAWRVTSNKLYLQHSVLLI